MRHTRASRIAGTVLICVATSRLAVGQADPTEARAAIDSISVRGMFKWEGGGDDIEPCPLPEDWGWDSLTWRLGPKEAIPPNGWTPGFTVGKVLSRDSAWIAFQGIPWGSRLSARGFIVPDSLLVTRRWSDTFTTSVSDAQGWFRVKLIDPWPEPTRAPVRAARLVGRVQDDSTGCAIFWCRLMIEGTKLGAVTDTLGRFEIADVPVGKMSLNACAFGYSWKHLVVAVPSGALTLRLRRQPGAALRAVTRCR